jgi:ligand-binding sensor domain-containing protein/signal transduction histidine kinase
MTEGEIEIKEKLRHPGLSVGRHLLLALFLTILVACGHSEEQTVVDNDFLSPSEIVATVNSPEHPPAAPHVQSIAALQEPFLGSSYLKFDQLSVEQGLSQSSVHAILQDHLGFMWFGTLDGLNRYDGYDIRVYKHDPEDPSSLSDNMIQALYEDRGGVLWIGTSAGGLNRFHRGSQTFARYRHDPNDESSLSNNSVISILEDSDGEMWAGTSGGGLNKLDRDTGQFTRYQNDPNDSLSLSNNTVWSIYEDNSGNLWVATNGGGLNLYDKQSGRFTSFLNDPRNPRSLANDYVVSVTEDEDGSLWIGTRGGVLHRYNPENGIFYRFLSGSIDPDSLIDHAVTDIIPDQTGKLWVATNGGGLKMFDPQSGQFTHYLNDISDPSSLSSNNIRAMYEDNAGVLWLGTDGGGVNKFAPSSMRFLHIQNDPSDPHSLSSNDVLAIYEDNIGDLWVGTLGGGLNRFEQESGRLTRYTHEPKKPNSLSSNTVFSIIQDKNGDMWIGTSSGLDRMDRQTDQFNRYQNEPDVANSLSHNVVLSISEDPEGVLWIGTSGGLNRFDPVLEHFSRFQNDPQDSRSISRGSVRAIHDDSAGSLWIATDNGLDRYDRKTGVFTHIRHVPGDPSSLSDNRVLAIHQDENGILWIGTYGGGLNRLDVSSGSIATYREKDGLPNDAILEILEDDDGFLWLSTIGGLSSFDPRSELFRNYDARDGLQSNEFNANAGFKDRDGKMYFGGINGFNAFYPGSIADNPYKPSIVLTSLTQGGESLDVQQTVDGQNEVLFRWPNDFFEFELSALSYSQPDKNQYAYRLVGYDEDWNNLGTRRSAHYANLPSGDYVLQLIGSNNDGVWNEEGISLKISVVPPFWQTSWFRVLMVVTVVGGTVGWYRLRVRGIEIRNRELEDQVEERTRDLELRTLELERRKNVAEGLREILVILNSNRSLEESLDYIVNQVSALTRADEVIIFNRDSDSGPTIITSSSGISKPLQELLPESVTSPVLNGEIFVFQDQLHQPDIHPDLTPLLADGHQTILGLPLSVGDDLYGGLVIYRSDSRSFSEEDLELSSIFADQAVLAIANAQLRAQAEQTAVAMERSRLARDLHDAVTQTLFSASLIAEVMPATWELNQDEGRHLLGELRQLSRGALAEMRTLLLELRPSALSDADLGDLLRQLADSLTGHTGTPVDLHIEGPCDLPPEVHVTVYRIAQEALNNVVKHSNASKVSISFRCNASKQKVASLKTVLLVVSDNGDGFDPDCIAADCLGLAIMRERSQAIGAIFHIESEIRKGTTVTIRWEERVVSTESEFENGIDDASMPSGATS